MNHQPPCQLLCRLYALHPPLKIKETKVIAEVIVMEETPEEAVQDKGTSTALVMYKEGELKEKEKEKEKENGRENKKRISQSQSSRVSSPKNSKEASSGHLESRQRSKSRDTHLVTICSPPVFAEGEGVIPLMSGSAGWRAYRQRSRTAVGCSCLGGRPC
jgi:hypothetical protein